MNFYFSSSKHYTRFRLYFLYDFRFLLLRFLRRNVLDLPPLPLTQAVVLLALLPLGADGGVVGKTAPKGVELAEPLFALFAP